MPRGLSRVANFPKDVHCERPQERAHGHRVGATGQARLVELAVKTVEAKIERRHAPPKYVCSNGPSVLHPFGTSCASRIGLERPGPAGAACAHDGRQDSPPPQMGGCLRPAAPPTRSLPPSTPAPRTARGGYSGRTSARKSAW